MKVAISTDSGQVAHHFGRCPQYTIAKVKQGNLKEKKTIENPGHEPGYIPEFLKEKGVDCVVSGGMGQKAISLFEKYGIKTIAGVSGSINEVLNQIANDELEGDDNRCQPGEGKGYGVERKEKSNDR